ncbi:MAG: membrane protein insertase YidC [Chitinophagaceae bacterium]
MNTDKNTIIGMVLLAILFFGYFYFTNQQNQFIVEQKQRQEDSINRIKAAQAKLIDTVAAKKDSLRRDSVGKITAAGNFNTAALGNEQLIVVENDVLKITFTNKGGAIKKVELKKYTSSYDSKNIVLAGNENNKISYNINTAQNTSTAIDGLYFTAMPIVKNVDGSQKIAFILTGTAGQSVTHEYVVYAKNYAIDWNVLLNGANQLISNGNFNIQWHTQTSQVERSAIYERQMSNICFSEEKEFDYISSKTEKKFEKSVQWVSVVQQFFNTTLIAKNNFNGGEINWQRSTDEDTTNTLAKIDVALPSKISGNNVTVPMQFFFGPNDYNILKDQADGMEQMVNLGRDIYSFVRPINKFIIMPVFNFLSGIVTNYGWAILLLTLFIRLITAPLMYGSYLSGAKMKVLRPELDVIKKKFGDDQQGFAMEQMKLFREAGVNPLGGCIPALLQIPIFFALYSFFNSNISLRGQSFLWSDDLSSYDVIATLPFSIPLGFGDHISLFTITAVLTSFAISLYNMGNTPTQDNPALKYMPYIFPFMMLFFFNRLPSALTWYYTVSNTVTLLLQFVIQTYIIDHDKIMAKMQTARSKPKSKSKSKWQEKYEQMMESQKKLQEMKDKTKK